MKKINLISLCSIFLLVSCSENPINSLIIAQNEIISNQNISYNQLALYPNPVGKIDSLFASLDFNKSDHMQAFNFKIKYKNSEDVYIDDSFKSINHIDSVVSFFSTSSKNEEKIFIENNRNIKYSPITLLSQTKWQYKKDTLVHNEKKINFYQVETDTIVNGNKIYTELHLFINSSTNRLESFERRNYFKNNLAQTVRFEYSDYSFNNDHELFVYDFPQNYKSVPFRNENEHTLLKVGQKAPNFNITDLNGNSINIEEFKNKKILLIFGTINCGYCKQTFMHFNQEDYRLSEDIAAIYINSTDEKVDLEDYVNKMKISFPVLYNAKIVNDLYGVSVYPTFFLINESGTIEKSILGYQKEFLQSLSSN